VRDACTTSPTPPAAFVEDCELEAGLRIAPSLHTPAGLLLNERESGIQVDCRACADALVPRAHDYLHDDMTVRRKNLCPEDLDVPNGHAHLRHAGFGLPGIPNPPKSYTLPVAIDDHVTTEMSVDTSVYQQARGLLGRGDMSRVGLALNVRKERSTNAGLRQTQRRVEESLEYITGE
jgi:hypothetical protein